MDPAFLEDIVEVHRTIIDPDAVLALGHCVGCDSSTGHILFDQHDL